MPQSRSDGLHYWHHLKECIWEASFPPSFATLNLPGGPVSAEAGWARWEGGALARLPDRDAASALRPRFPPCLRGYRLSSGPATPGPWSPCPGLSPTPTSARACERGLPGWASRGALHSWCAGFLSVNWEDRHRCFPGQFQLLMNVK